MTPRDRQRDGRRRQHERSPYQDVVLKRGALDTPREIVGDASEQTREDVNGRRQAARAVRILLLFPQIGLDFRRAVAPPTPTACPRCRRAPTS